uniref:Uncharacterized protein n=1 Tax=viral metagenome TaxID=1070528 RepID=A0A6H1ZHR8_9ZZZZ
MKFDTNEERQESTARVIEGARNDIGEIKAKLRSIYETRKGLDIKYLDIFYNVTDEEFEILGIFTIFGRVFWVSKANTIILKTVFVDEFIGEVEEWIQCYVTREKRLKNKYPENKCPVVAEFHQGEVREGHIADDFRNIAVNQQPMLRPNNAQARHTLNRIHNDLVAAPDVNDHPMPPFR